MVAAPLTYKSFAVALVPTFPENKQESIVTVPPFKYIPPPLNVCPGVCVLFDITQRVNLTVGGLILLAT